MESNVIISKLDEILDILHNAKQQEKQVLNLSEAASFLSVSKSYIYKLTSQNLIPHSCPTGKKLYFKLTDLTEFLSTHNITTDEQIKIQANKHKNLIK
jgi:excisionase family DNA binding protein